MPAIKILFRHAHELTFDLAYEDMRELQLRLRESMVDRKLCNLVKNGRVEMCIRTEDVVLYSISGMES